MPRKARHVLFLLGLFALSCSTIQELQQAMSNVSRLKFKLAGVDNFELASVRLSGKSSINFSDGASLAAAYARGSLPASFTLEISAINPNDGQGGTRMSNATLTAMQWTLLIDNSPTISGNLTAPVAIPGTGEQVTFPLRINLDLVTFFKEKGYDHILKLALALGGASGSASRLTLRARPTVQTQLGPIAYPGEITIVDKEYR